MSYDSLIPTKDKSVTLVVVRATRHGSGQEALAGVSSGYLRYRYIVEALISTKYHWRDKAERGGELPMQLKDQKTKTGAKAPITILSIFFYATSTARHEFEEQMYVHLYYHSTYVLVRAKYNRDQPGLRTLWKLKNCRS